ncbi:MrcB family domain-containing protein [Maricaulis sp. D1M11]|uniref:MrcB family domain-containing protein n=1 Tax=Maricaulis sp. D1M11 TaxID=3076117 RepID=UPI0039B42946
MRDALLKWVSTYPTDPGYRDGSFANAQVGKTVRTELPALLKDLLHQPGRYALKGSIGQSDWADVPWVAVMDQSVTTSIQEGYYLVYLLSRGCDRLYLVLGQGCTRLYNESGKKAAEAELKRRGAAMRARAEPSVARLLPIMMNLNAPASNWRASLYEASIILGKEYETQALPSQATLEADYREALELYRLIAREGGWSSDDEIALEAELDGIEGSLAYQKSYRQHRRAERSAKHSREVKKHHKAECAACGFTTKGAYQLTDESDLDILEAHHLIPLHTLADGEIARFDIMKNFALLCPNCHRMIHRLGADKLDALRQQVKRTSE